MSSKHTHSDKDLDLSYKGRGVWLVKVPKYVASRWMKAPENIEVGRLKIVKKPAQKADVSLSLSEAIMCMSDEDEDIPKEHKFAVSSVASQTLGVFSQYTPSEDTDAIIPETDKLCLEGKVIQKGECMPMPSDQNYMNMKMKKFVAAAQPQRQVMKLDRAVNSYRPVANHKHLIEYSERKKVEGKKARDDRDKVMDMLFAAFEKHQYYNIKDLVGITKQPVTYLKEILSEVCNYNSKNPHRNMWELKPEYRHYKSDQDPGVATTSSD